MKLSAIVLARAIGYVETYDLNPRGKIFSPDFLAALIKRYRFQVFPQKQEELDESKGITFRTGIWDGVEIEQLVIYNTGILVDTRASTKVSRKLLEEALVWGRDQFGLTYTDGMIKRWAYISNLTFYSDARLSSMHPALEKLAQQVTAAVPEYSELNLSYEVVGFNMNVDVLKIRFPRSHFMIQRRNDAALSDNKYYSESPLDTDDHIKLLQEFETSISTH
jgi:hypothetical protein